MKMTDGQLVLLGHPEISANELSGKHNMLRSLRSADDNEAQDADFHEIRLTLSFELGRQELSVGELRNLEPGHVFDMTRPTRNAVDIYAGARRLGQGEIVEINGTLGVRITRLFNNE
jgi:type III secretion system YscQ/HrcQ family protein